MILQQTNNEIFTIISTITGHRVNDLSYDMYLEGDLGLDSIKMITLMNELMKIIPPEKQEWFSVQIIQFEKLMLSRRLRI